MILILGGMKSGKSSFASNRAAQRASLGSVVYLATARAGDEEMAERIRRHQDERPRNWSTIEEPDNPADYFEWLVDNAASTGRRLSENSRLNRYCGTADDPATVILDCITLWLTNLLAPLGDEPDRQAALNRGEAAVDRLIKAVREWEIFSLEKDRQCLIVSNQVENGLISPWTLGRIFQDLAGLSHQRIAGAADEVYLMSAGLPQKLR